jgi:Cell wall-associated hydrolases (invasion-associated proteins)
MSSTMSFFSQPRTLATSRLAVLLALGTLAGCARAPIRLAVSPSRGPTLGATVGPLTVAGALGAGGMDVRVRSTGVTGRRRWSPPPAVVSASAVRVLATADRYLGTRYRYGGESPAEGFDCSGFVQFVFGRNGVELPRTSRQQASAGRAGPREIAGLQPGDLLFFATRGRRVDHVAIYAGDGRIIHASSGAGKVRYDGIDTDRGEWYLRRFVTARRVLGGVQGV